MNDPPRHGGDTDEAEEDDTCDHAEHDLEEGVRLVGEYQQTDTQHGEGDASQEYSPPTGGRLWEHHHPGTTQLLALLTHSSEVDTLGLSTPVLLQIVYVQPHPTTSCNRAR